MIDNHAIDILLVEDNESDVELMKRALRNSGPKWEIAVATDGAEALDFLFCTGKFTQRRPAAGPRIVLLDLKLPRVNGLEVLARMKADERAKGIPVVVFSSSDEPSDVFACYRLGANGYVKKPVEYDAYMHAVADIFNFWLVTNLTTVRGNGHVAGGVPVA